jgi:hypothetical protein
MARDKKTIKFNPLDKIAQAPKIEISAKTSVKSPAKPKTRIKSEPKTPVKQAPKLAPKVEPKLIPKPVAKAISKVKVGKAVDSVKGSQPEPSKEVSAYQELDGVIGYSEGISRDWQQASLQFEPKTQTFGFFHQSGNFVGFSAKTLKSQIHGGSLLPKAIVGLVLGGGVGFALSYILAKSPERFVYFQLQNDAGSSMYLRLNSKAMSYII